MIDAEKLLDDEANIQRAQRVVVLERIKESIANCMKAEHWQMVGLDPLPASFTDHQNPYDPNFLILFLKGSKTIHGIECLFGLEYHCHFERTKQIGTVHFQKSGLSLGSLRLSTSDEDVEATQSHNLEVVMRVLRGIRA